MRCPADVAQASSPASSPGVSPGVRAGGETPPQLAAGTAALRGSLRGPRFRIGIWFRLHRAAESVRHALLFSALFLLLNWATCGGAAVVSPIHSPDGSVEFMLFQRESRLTYSITFRNKPVIEASPLIVMVDGVDLTDGVEFGEV